MACQKPTSGNITKSDSLVELLNIATKNQLFQFEGSLYEQIDGVAMGSPLGTLMANTFMCSIEDRLQDYYYDDIHVA